VLTYFQTFAVGCKLLEAQFLKIALNWQVVESLQSILSKMEERE
jgi:hypothetical protein